MEKTLKSKGMLDRHGEAKTPAEKTMCGKNPEAEVMTMVFFLHGSEKLVRNKDQSMEKTLKSRGM